MGFFLEDYLEILTMYIIDLQEGMVLWSTRIRNSSPLWVSPPLILFLLQWDVNFRTSRDRDWSKEVWLPFYFPHHAVLNPIWVFLILCLQVRDFRFPRCSVPKSGSDHCILEGWGMTEEAPPSPSQAPASTKEQYSKKGNVLSVFLTAFLRMEVAARASKLYLLTTSRILRGRSLSPLFSVKHFKMQA